MQSRELADKNKRWDLLPLVGVWVVCCGRIKKIYGDEVLLVSVSVRYRELEIKLDHVWIRRTSNMDTLRFRDIYFMAQVFKYERLVGTSDFGLRDFRLINESAINLSSGLYVIQEKVIHSIPAGTSVVCRGVIDRMCLSEKQAWISLYPAEIINEQGAIRLPKGAWIQKIAYITCSIEVGRIIELTANIVVSSGLSEERGIKLSNIRDTRLV
jgi:hypothetical protein